VRKLYQNQKTKKMSKKCIIIGNAPIRKDQKGLGEMIDSYDHVIRMNNFKTVGFEKDLGSKTTIWANGIADLQRRDLSKMRRIWNVFPVFSHEGGSSVLMRSHLLDTIELREILNIYEELSYRKEGFPHPSTGIMTIRIALERLSDYQIDVFNFNFFSSSNDKTNKNHHYWGEDNGFDKTHKYVEHAHDGDNERRYLESLIKAHNNLNCIKPPKGYSNGRR